VLRSIQLLLILSLLCGLAGCFGPAYGPTYGYPDNGYAPYSYGWPVYARGYAPVFVVHHPWEEHHEGGHRTNFFHGPPDGAHFGGHAGSVSGHMGGAHDGGGGHR
jgi:hypothetical protein